MTVGDIPWVELPAANGYEQRGRRPAVILQDEHYAGGLPVVLVVPLTTARVALRFAGTTLIRPTSENGLRQASVALVFQIRAIDRCRVQERIGSVSTEVLQEIFAELDKLTEHAPRHRSALPESGGSSHTFFSGSIGRPACSRPLTLCRIRYRHSR